MKKGVPFEWDKKYQHAFESLKEYLKNPIVLAAPEKGRPLILYIAVMDNSLGALLEKKNDEGPYII